MTNPTALKTTTPGNSNADTQAADTSPLDREIATHVEQIRKQAEAKIEAIHVVAKAHRALTDAREEFARIDKQNADRLAAATAAARRAGFTDKELAQWAISEPTKRAPRRSASRGKRTRVADTDAAEQTH
ncbi:hypothetical protein [Rhodococcus rhodnii]|uniref:hypothetical protein n=1 Tax=Rhodococcus rhodnii TaxID=38312 RepID=UPI0009F986E2|nr:hypothetical protein [Rhodococcus rhodnii]